MPVLRIIYFAWAVLYACAFVAYTLKVTSKENKDSPDIALFSIVFTLITVFLLVHAGRTL